MDGKVIAKKLLLISTGINGALDNPEILTPLERFSFGTTKLQQGKALLHVARESVTNHVKEYGEQYGATQTTQTAFEESYARYLVIIKVCRVAFKGNIEALTKLLATGTRKRTIAGWLQQANITYTNLIETPELLARINQFGYTKTRLVNELHNVTEVERNYQLQLKETGEAQQATKDRDKALEDLSQWYSDFRAIARIALYEKPQLLEALGIKVK